MRRPDALALIAAAWLPAIASAAAPVLPRPSLPVAPAQGDLRATLPQALAMAQGGDCAGALALLDPVAARADLAPGDRDAVQLLRLPCLSALGRIADAAAAQALLVRTQPNNPLVRSSGVLLAAQAGRFDDAARALEAIATDQPQALALISGTAWRGIAQKLTEQHADALRDRVSIALARADWQPADRPELRDAVAQEAIRALLADRQTSEAGLLVERIDTPELLVGMATERAYAAVWPAVEARMGATQAASIDRFAAARLDAFARDDDPAARRDAVRAFALLGRTDDAGEVAAPVTIAAGMDDAAVTTVRYHAQALAAAGRRDQAIARLMPFATLDLARAPLAASGLIGLAELLDEAGRPAEALRVAATGLTAGQALSPWGLAWLRRTEVCALATLGRPEARVRLDALLAASADNEAAAVEGALCAGRRDAAAALAVKTLATAEGASRLVDQFQPGGAIGAGPSRLRALWAPLLARPDVKAAFEKAGRILPQRYWPATTPRAIPRAANPPGAPTT